MGKLCVREFRRAGLHPLLAGRSAVVGELARRAALPSAIFDLRAPRDIERHLAGVRDHERGPRACDVPRTSRTDRSSRRQPDRGGDAQRRRRRRCGGRGGRADRTRRTDQERDRDARRRWARRRVWAKRGQDDRSDARQSGFVARGWRLLRRRACSSGRRRRFAYASRGIRQRSGRGARFRARRHDGRVADISAPRRACEAAAARASRPSAGG